VIRRSVAVLIELDRTAHAGGHVKTWERLATAATGRADLDLTVYVLGHDTAVDEISDNVRFVALRPVLSARRAQRLVGGGDPTDLSPWHPALARLLPRHDVWHLTHLFAFAATATMLARRTNHPLVASVHTDVPRLTEIYLGGALRRLPLPEPVPGIVADSVAAVARRGRDRILRRCRHVLVSNDRDAGEVGRLLGADHVSPLRRGIDADIFTPAAADPTWRRRHGIPPDRPVVVFAGRVDATKGVLVLAEALRRLDHDGLPAQLVVAGDGADAPAVRSLLGDRATVLGRVPQEELAMAYASADLFALPSRTETVGNVVAEAMACGLPPVLPAGAATTQWLATPGTDGVVVAGDGVDDWAQALSLLLDDPDRVRGLGKAALETSTTNHPAWERVLEEDLLPVWSSQALVGTERGSRRR
jgi:glycosyltransferase involved in cell wall biosynthesis